MGFKERYERTVAEAAACCEACGRDPKSVVVVAVSKTVGADEVAEAIEDGAHDFGENRPDSLEGKRARFPQQTSTSSPTSNRAAFPTSWGMPRSCTRCSNSVTCRSSTPQLRRRARCKTC